MAVELIQPATGRGAWSKKGAGGTLSLDGKTPGQFYRAPAGDSEMIGLAALRLIRAGKPVSANDYAVFRAVVAIQREVGAYPDGVFGAGTQEDVLIWQGRKGLVADGVVGQASTRAMFQPWLKKAAAAVTNAHKDLYRVANGHTWSESSMDPGCVGPSTPEDLGLCQINGRWHPDMSADERLDPRKALAWQAGFVQDNIEAMGGKVSDGIAAYLLGVGGAKQWVKAGRPDVWTRTVTSGGVEQQVSTPVGAYVDTVWENGTR